MGCRTYFSRRRLDVALAVALGLILFAASWYRHASVHSTMYDLGVFEQVVWKMAHGRGATSSLTAWNTFADHLSPVLLVFVPLYRLAATPLWFFAAQAIAVGLAVLCVRPLVGAVGLDEDSPGAKLLLGAFVVSPAIWNATLYDFHPTTLAVPVIMIGVHAALRQRHRDMWLAFGALLLLRDDLALLAVAFACVGWLADAARGRRLRAALMASGLAWTVIGSKLGVMWGASRHFIPRYGYLGDSMTDAALHPFHSGPALLNHVFRADNIVFVVALLLPFAFLPLARPAWFGLALFCSMPVLAAVEENFKSPAYHYAAPVVPFLLIAAAGALMRVRADALPRAAALCAGISAVAFALVGPPATGTLTNWAPKASDLRAALKLVKSTDGVAAGSLIGPHVADRDVLIPFPWPFFSRKINSALDPRVKSTSPATQAKIDVVIIANPPRPSPLKRKFLELPEVQQHFEEYDFGTVTVFRRR